MTPLKCPSCGQQSCQYDFAFIECSNCNAQPDLANLEENLEEAEAEGIPMECPFCERPALEFFVTGETCSNCDHHLEYEETNVKDLLRNFDDEGDQNENQDS
jgi:hypothetical protein